MARVALFTLPIKAHLNPSAALVKELVNQGEEVVYYALEAYRREVEAAGATFRPHPDFGFNDVPLSKNEFEVAARLWSITERIIDVLLEQVRSDQPDYIIHDSFCSWGRPIAHLLGLPGIASVHGLALNKAVVNHYAQPNLTTVRSALRSSPYIARMWWRKTRLERRYALPPASLLDWVAGPQPLNLVYTSRAVQPVSESFDASYRFVGPTIIDRPPLPFPLESLKGEGPPVVYIALGTLYNNNLTLYQACLGALGGGPYRVVLSVGPSTDMTLLGTIPSNVIVRPAVPQLEVLRRTDIFISHGGMKSVNEALYYGVPMVVVPQGVDQPVLAERVAQLGAGLTLNPGEVSADSLRRRVSQVLNEPLYRQKSRALGATLRSAGGYKQATVEILEHVERLGLNRSQQQRTIVSGAL